MGLASTRWFVSANLSHKNPDGDRLLKISEVQRLTTLSRTTIYALLAEGEFPKPVELTKRRVAWWQSGVMDWVERR